METRRRAVLEVSMKLLKDLDLKVGDKVKCVGNAVNACLGAEYEVVPHEYLKGELALDLNTLHELKSYSDSLFEKVGDKPLITIDGEYALSDDPYTPIRILCVDRPHRSHPVVIMDKDGNILKMRADGSKNYPDGSYIVPLKKKVGTIWCVFDKNNNLITLRNSEELAERFIRMWEPKNCNSYEIVKMVQSED